MESNRSVKNGSRTAACGYRISWAVAPSVVDFTDQTALTEDVRGVNPVFVHVPVSIMPAEMVVFAEKAFRAIAQAGVSHTGFPSVVF